MHKPCRGCKIVNLFDYDGKSVSERDALKRENELLRRQNERLMRILRRYKDALGEK